MSSLFVRNIIKFIFSKGYLIQIVLSIFNIYFELQQSVVKADAILTALSYLYQ